MLRSMPAVVSPQTIVNGCTSAVEATGLGRGTELLDWSMAEDERRAV